MPWKLNVSASPTALCRKGRRLMPHSRFAKNSPVFRRPACAMIAFPRIQQWGMSHDEALRNETRIGFETIASGETLDGASRFSGGEGRHGKFS